ncbi:hypothetical protein Tco_0516347 [Tanacetum coccineum]
MELESSNSGPTTKLHILKLATVEEKTNKKNDVKARSLLLMALPNEHQLTFSQYPDAESMFAAIETRFKGNAATKKTQKTLLKQQYENFSATSAESLDSIFNRIHKIVSRLAILGVVIAQEDLNSNILSSLPPEWNTHVIVWMNKPEVETMSIDDLYNNFKIVEQKVKKSVGRSSGSQNLAFMTAPSTNSTNDTNTTSPQVSTTSPNVNAGSSQVSTASVSDNTVYAFMVENLNGSNVLHQDLEQIHKDDLEGMDLKWQLSLLSMRAKKYYQRTGKKIFINANDIARIQGCLSSKVIGPKGGYNDHKDSGLRIINCDKPSKEDGKTISRNNNRQAPQHDDNGFVDSGCSRHMTENIAYLLDFKEFDGGYVAFGGGAYGGRITVTACTISNDSAETSEEVIQDCIVMPIWKDISYFDSPTKDVENDEPKTADDAQKQEDGPNNKNAEQESQDKFVSIEILMKFNLSDRSMIGSLMYLMHPDQISCLQCVACA